MPILDPKKEAGNFKPQFPAHWIATPGRERVTNAFEHEASVSGPCTENWTPAQIQPRKECVMGASWKLVEEYTNKENKACKICGYKSRELRTTRVHVEHHFWRYWCSRHRSSVNYILIHNHQKARKENKKHPPIIYRVYEGSYVEFVSYMGTKQPQIFRPCLSSADEEGKRVYKEGVVHQVKRSISSMQVSISSQ